MKTALRRTLGCLFALVLASDPRGLHADEVKYERAPPVISAALDGTPTPTFSLSPDRTTYALMWPQRYPPIAVESRPFLRLAGLRIDPGNNALHRAPSYYKMTLNRVGERAPLVTIDAPSAKYRLSALRWNSTGSMAAYTLTDSTGVRLRIVDVARKTTSAVDALRLNPVLGSPFSWMPGGARLLVRALPARGAMPQPASVPYGPIVQQTSGKSSGAATYEDLLASPTDEAQFDYFARSQLALVDATTHAIARIGNPGLIAAATTSPSGAFLLVAQLHRPFSYLLPATSFPRRTQVWDVRGSLVKDVADAPLAERVPVEGVPTGPRTIHWRPTAPAMLDWVEALDKGDEDQTASARDALYSLAAPFTGAPAEGMRIEHRLASMTYIEGTSQAFVVESDRRARLSRTFLTDLVSSAQPKLVATLRDGDRYNDPGKLASPPGAEPAAPGIFGVAMRDGTAVYLLGEGASREGLRPFVDRLDTTTLAKSRVFASELQPLESPLAVLDAKASRLIVSRTSRTEPLNFALRDGASETMLTAFADPQPQIRGIARRLVTYKRADGVDLSFTLYLPPGYKDGTKLPTVLWAYPLEFNDASVAGQVSDSTQGLLTIGGYSELFLCLQGYAVLDNASIPIVGDSRTVNDTYVDQLVAGAKAAIDKAVELGVTDPDRVGVGGHSYGAFMTANLLAHTRLFRAGIARSGAYNRTLTPFGFQSERRTYWDATDLYTKLSPFTYANAIKDPLLMIHGMADDNSGTFPIQSERMYAAIKGNGGTARLVMLPAEAHGYAARESTETVLAEMIAWLDTYVKNAQPRTPAP